MKVLFRVDASRQIGIGHIMRCLALAEALKLRGCDSIFLTRDYGGLAINIIQKNGFKKIEVMACRADLGSDFNTFKRIALKHHADLAVTDSYNLDCKYYHNIKKMGLKLLVIDDLAKNHISADIVLNQNIYANRLNYSSGSGTKLLLGTQYTLLKRNFYLNRNRYKLSKLLRNMLITLGGSENKDKCIIKIIEALGQSGRHKLNFKIIGRTSSTAKDILRNSGIKYVLKDTVNNIWAEMLWADLTICGGGTTTYELCCLGVPFATVVLADNQELNCKFLERKNISINLGWHNKLNPREIKIKLLGLIDDYKRRAVMSKNGRELVDGKGTERVLDEILG